MLGRANTDSMAAYTSKSHVAALVAEPKSVKTPSRAADSKAGAELVIDPDSVISFNINNVCSAGAVATDSDRNATAENVGCDAVNGAAEFEAVAVVVIGRSCTPACANGAASTELREAMFPVIVTGTDRAALERTSRQRLTMTPANII